MTPEPSNVVWISKSAVAQRAQVRPSTVDKWVADGLLTTRQLPGGITRIPLHEVEELIARSTRQALAPSAA